MQTTTQQASGAPRCLHSYLVNIILDSAIVFVEIFGCFNALAKTIIGYTFAMDATYNLKGGLTFRFRKKAG